MSRRPVQAAMLYVVSKFFGFLAQPSTLLWIMLVVGLWYSRRPRLTAHPIGRSPGWWMAITAAALFFLAGLTPVSTWLMVPLEERFPRLELMPGLQTYAGVVVLGGGEDGRASVLRRQLHINEAGDRITEAAVIAKKLPDVKIVFTGGVSAIINDPPAGAEAVGAFWRSIGIEESRIIIESKSRNTFENALFTHELLKPQAGARYLLVTSAAHMPRAVGVFRKAGFDVVAYPTDYRTNYPADAADTFGSIPAGLKRFDDGIKEWIGLFAYWLMGRTSALFPGPD